MDAKSPEALKADPRMLNRLRNIFGNGQSQVSTETAAQAPTTTATPEQVPAGQDATTPQAETGTEPVDKLELLRSALEHSDLEIAAAIGGQTETPLSTIGVSAAATANHERPKHIDINKRPGTNWKTGSVYHDRP